MHFGKRKKNENILNNNPIINHPEINIIFRLKSIIERKYIVDRNDLVLKGKFYQL